jgi:two-component system, NarL family, response regulator NreC
LYPKFIRNMISVFLVDDHEMYLEGLALLLKKQLLIDVIGTAQSGNELLSVLPTLQADILLLDVQLSDMNEETLLKEIKAIRPTQKIIYLSLMRGTRFIHKLTKYKIQGYVLKNAATAELLEAINVVHNGGSYFSKEIDILTSNDFRNTITIEDKRIEDILSKREIEVLKMVCKEYSNIAISEQLFLSVSTVETHRKNLIAKLGVNNTVGLVKFAIKNKLID